MGHVNHFNFLERGGPTFHARSMGPGANRRGMSRDWLYFIHPCICFHALVRIFKEYIVSYNQLFA